MPLMGRITAELVGHLNKETEQQVIANLPMYYLTPNESWQRLLHTNRLVKRLFPKSAFLAALDSPPKKKVRYCDGTGPR